MRPFFRCFLSASFVIATSFSANAATVTMQQDAGVGVESEYGMSAKTSTHGRHLGGMQLTASYLDGTTEDLVWQAYSGHGDVTGSGLYMFFAWDHFELTTTKRLTSLSMDAASGNAIFDIFTLEEGEDGNTTGTARGFSYRMRDAENLNGNVDVTYSNLMSLKGTEAQGDAYTHMLIDYSGLEGGGFLGYVEFATDMDSLAVAGDLNPVSVSNMPLPAGMPLLLAGLGVLGLYKRKRR